MYRNIDLLLDLTGQQTEPQLLRAALESMLLPEKCSETGCSAAVLLPTGMPEFTTPVPPHWSFVSTVQPVLAANEYLEKVSRENRHLLVLFEPVLPTEEAVKLLADVFTIDPYFGMAVPRRLHPTTGEILKLSSDLGDPDLVSLPRKVLAKIPQHYILPETASSCFLLRNSVLSNFDFLDETYETLAGAFQHYLWRARRCGFRCAVVNCAVAPGNGSCRFVIRETDAHRLYRQHPDVGLAKAEFAEHSLHVHESLLGRALSRERSIRQTLLVDARGVSKHVTGTLEAVLGLCNGLAQIDPDWAITLLAAPETHNLAERFPNWKIVSELDSRYFTAALRLFQPWDISSMVDLHRVALFNFYMMLDNIAWDVLFAAPPGLGATWKFLSTHADGILYISEFTRERFAGRFPLARITPGYVSHLSFDPVDYSESTDSNDRGDFLFVVGNMFDHKDVAPTVDLLSSTFPFRNIKALGLKSHPSHLVDALPSGEIPQSDVDRLFREAGLVVFPSFYEGFGFPVLKALSSGCTILARHSELLMEIASHYRGPGRLIAYHNRTELVEAIGRVIHDSQIAEVPLGTALHDTEKPKGWKEIAAGVLRFIEQQVQNVDRCRWLSRQSSIEQMNAYHSEKM